METFVSEAIVSEAIVSSAPVHDVPPGAAPDDVVPVIAVDFVVGLAIDRTTFLAITIQDVITQAAEDLVVACIADDHVVAVPACHEVSTLAANERVVALFAVKLQLVDVKRASSFDVFVASFDVIVAQTTGDSQHFDVALRHISRQRESEVRCLHAIHESLDLECARVCLTGYKIVVRVRANDLDDVPMWPARDVVQAGRIGEIHGVLDAVHSALALNDIGTDITTEHIVTVAAQDVVVTFAAEERVVADITQKDVIAQAALQTIVADGSVEHVGARIARERIVALATEQAVPAHSSSERVVPNAAVQGVITSVAD